MWDIVSIGLIGSVLTAEDDVANTCLKGLLRYRSHDPIERSFPLRLGDNVYKERDFRVRGGPVRDAKLVLIAARSYIIRYSRVSSR